MRHLFISICVLFALSACGTISGTFASNPLTEIERTDMTVEQKLFEAQGEFNAILSGIVAYSSKQSCSAIIIINCSIPSVVTTLNQNAQRANIALEASKTARDLESLGVFNVLLSSLQQILARAVRN